MLGSSNANSSPTAATTVAQPPGAVAEDPASNAADIKPVDPATAAETDPPPDPPPPEQLMANENNKAPEPDFEQDVEDQPTSFKDLPPHPFDVETRPEPSGEVSEKFADWQDFLNTDRTKMREYLKSEDSDRTNLDKDNAIMQRNYTKPPSNPFSRVHVYNGTSTVQTGNSNANTKNYETGGRTRYGIEEIQYKPHLTELYRSENLKGTNLEDFFCTRNNFPTTKRGMGKQEYPNPMLFAPFRKDPQTNTPMLWSLAARPKKSWTKWSGNPIWLYSRIGQYLSREALESWHTSRVKQERAPNEAAGSDTYRVQAGKALAWDVGRQFGKALTGPGAVGAYLVTSNPLYLGPYFLYKSAKYWMFPPKQAKSGSDLLSKPLHPTIDNSREARDVRIALLRQKAKAIKHAQRMYPSYYYRGRSSKSQKQQVNPLTGKKTYNAIPDGHGDGASSTSVGLFSRDPAKTKANSGVPNLRISNPAADLLNSANLPKDLAKEPPHPWLKLADLEISDTTGFGDSFANKPNPYLHVTLEDTTAGQVLWDAVYNMRNQKQLVLSKTSMLGKARAMFSKTLDQEIANTDPSFLREDATAIHGVQKEMLKLCPRTTDLVPRTYVLNVKRWPSVNVNEDYVGKMIFQSYLTTDPIPNFERIDFHSKNNFGVHLSDADKFAMKNSSSLSDRFLALFWHDLHSWTMGKFGVGLM
ncbi:unnamed protein product [Amoebophrya sp. A120]|nr:unnamed protein product [Amoebophrya sp. A120]|eukprot:GSA120T00004449001.1